MLRRIRAWWNKDAVEVAEEETRMTPAERDVAQEDYRAREDDQSAREYFPGGTPDFEGDSERPR